MFKHAVLSHDRKFRYTLHRIWDGSLPLLNWILVNPSTADASVDDRTIKRLIAFTKESNIGKFGGIMVLNLFSFRTKSPKILKEEAGDDVWSVIGPKTNSYLKSLENDHSAHVVFGWGTNGSLGNRDRDVIKLFKNHPNVYCLDITKFGHPGHPLYIKSGTPFKKFYPEKVKNFLKNRVFPLVEEERLSQDSKWGNTRHHPCKPDDDNFIERYLGIFSEIKAKDRCDNASKDEGEITWTHISLEEFSESVYAKTKNHRKKELIQLIAVACAWLEDIEREEK